MDDVPFLCKHSDRFPSNSLVDIHSKVSLSPSLADNLLSWPFFKSYVESSRSFFCTINRKLRNKIQSLHQIHPNCILPWGRRRITPNFIHQENFRRIFLLRLMRTEQILRLNFSRRCWCLRSSGKSRQLHLWLIRGPKFFSGYTESNPNMTRVPWTALMH